MNLDPEKVQGYYWHVVCVYGPPGDIRDDNGGEPKRGTFIDRAITMRLARRLDKGETATCHLCLKDLNKDASPSGDEDDFIVVDYGLAASLCDCGDTHHGGHHGADRELLNEIWKNAGEMKGAKVAERLVCGDCWYKENNRPPDERRTMPDGIDCWSCDDPVTEVVVIKTEPASDTHVDADEVEDGVEYKVRVTWTRSHRVRTTYEYYITDLDEYDMEALRGDEFQDIAWDIAGDNSDEDYETDSEFHGFVDDGPEDVAWEVSVK